MRVPVIKGGFFYNLKDFGIRYDFERCGVGGGIFGERVDFVVVVYADVAGNPEKFDFDIGGVVNEI